MKCNNLGKETAHNYNVKKVMALCQNSNFIKWMHGFDIGIIQNLDKVLLQ